MEPRDEKPIAVSPPTDLDAQLEDNIRDIKEGIAEVDRREFASAGEVKAFFAKYGG